MKPAGRFREKQNRKMFNVARRSQRGLEFQSVGLNNAGLQGCTTEKMGPRWLPSSLYCRVLICSAQAPDSTETILGLQNSKNRWDPAYNDFATLHGSTKKNTSLRKN